MPSASSHCPGHLRFALSSHGSLSVAVAFALAACDSGSPSSSRYTVRDSAGVQIVESTAPLWEEASGWSIAPRPIVSIGAVDGPEEYLFDRIRGVLRLPDGRIVVVNGGSAEIRFFASDGTYLSSTGGSGDGPGEFRGVLSAALVGDSLLVYDGGLNRLSVLNLDGEFLTSRQLASNGDPVHPNRMYALEGPIPGRGYVFTLFSRAADMRPAPVLYWESGATLLYSYNGTLEGEIGWPSGSDMFSTPERAGTPEFGAWTATDLYQGRLHIGHGRPYEVAVFGPEGTLERLIRRVEAPQTIAAAIPRLLEWAGEQGAPPEALLDFRRRLETEPQVEIMPFYSDLVLDTLGNLWVERYRPRWTTGPHAWEVFDPEGRWLGRIDLPEDLEVYEIGRDFVLGVWSNEVDVQHVRMYSLERE